MSIDNINIRQVYLNGEFMAPAAAKVSAFDRGFIYGDGVYEVIPVFGRRLFRFSQHFERLEASLGEIRIRNPLTAAKWRTVFEKLISDTPAPDQSIYVQITRGTAPRDHAFPAGAAPTTFAYAQPINYPTAEQIARGASAITARDDRWTHCNIKAISLLANVLLRQQAIDSGATEAILIRDGFMTEGAACNIFIVAGGRVITPPKGPLILPGITRDLILDLLRTHGIPSEERAVREQELAGADEIWLTSSGKEIMPVTQLNGKPVGNGKPGPVHARALEHYRDYKRAFAEGKVE